MLKIGETVQYFGNGLCTVDEIITEDFGSGKMDYYVLRPVMRRFNTFYIPANNQKMLLKVRRILTAEEIEQIISELSQNKTVWIEDDAERKESYRKIIADGDFCGMIKAVRSIHFHRDELKFSGRKLHLIDEIMLKDAENILYDELALVLKIEKEDVYNYIIK